ncbi:radical SAM protein [bacterium SM23_57]|nr:MAG: radical SAM protein [bacterium SM23_57]
MNILLVYPEYPDTFWSFKHALKFIFRKAANPPLGLLTVAAMLPKQWKKKLVDMNVTKLKDGDLAWADMVFISGMSIQKISAKSVIHRCKKMGVKIVAGGPLFTAAHNDFDDVDHLVLNEAEITLPPFLKDLQNGHPKHLYSSDQWADIAQTPTPLWELVDIDHYAYMCIQYSRGCPFNCDFCDITALYGRKPRMKDRDQIVAELESLYSTGWRGGIFFVDDNFIGNRKNLKKEILPAIADWNSQKKYHLPFTTQVSIDLADDDELMRLMTAAGFDIVFVGIETPNEDSLKECTKSQNANRDLLACVKKIQSFGMQVEGGFIVGFDNDPLSIFDRQIEFIQKSGIVTAMVGLLNAPRGTRLYRRLEKENRLLVDASGDNTDCSINFIPKMSHDTLMTGYKKILTTIYSPAYYYDRVREFLKGFKPTRRKKQKFHFRNIATLCKSSLHLGIIGKERLHYWKLFFWSLLRHPRLFPLAITYAVYGFHFRKIIEKYVMNL